MPVSKAETRIPNGLTHDDLGQAVLSSSRRAVLISYYQSPVIRDRKQSYVVMVTDTTLQGLVVKYRWQVLGTDVETTEGVFEFTPTSITSLTLNLTILGAADAVLETISLQQTVVSPNEDLENLIVQSNTTYPVAADPTTSREVINDYLGLIHAVAPVSTASVMNRLLFGISYIESQANAQTARDTLITSLRTALQSGSSGAAGFYTAASAGAGICGLKPELFVLLAVVIPGTTTLMTVTLPSAVPATLTADQVTATLAEIRTALAAMNEDSRIDLFNRMRFPKASLNSVKLMIDCLRARSFSSRSLDAIYGSQPDMLSLIDKYKTGPHT